MKYFAIFTLILGFLYLIGFINTSRNSGIKFMDKHFTTAIKGFSILTVVWAHTGGRLGVGGVQFIAGVGVSLFIICSGYGLEYSYQHNGLKDFWKKRFLRVCIPFWFVELLGLIIIKSWNIKTYVEDIVFVKPVTSYSWFIKYILICYLIFYIVKILKQKTKIGDCKEVVILCVVFSIWFLIESIWFANPNMPFLRARQMLSFPLGIMLFKYKDYIERVLTKKNNFIILIGGSIVGIAFMVITQFPVIKNLNYVFSNTLSLFTVFPLAISVLSLVEILPNLFKNKMLKYFGEFSYEIYLVHAFTLGVVSTKLLNILCFILITIVFAVVLKYLTDLINKKSMSK